MNKKVNWIEIARRGRGMAPLITEATALGWRSGIFKKLTGGPNMHFYRHFDSARWFDAAEVEKVKSYLRNQEMLHPGFLVQLGRKLIRYYLKIKSWVRKNAKSDYKQYTNLELAKAFWSFYSRTFYIPVGYCYIFANKFLPDEIIPELARKEPRVEQQTRYFSVLFSLDKFTEIKAEKLSLLKITKSGKLSQKALKNHWQKYKHLKRYCYYGSDYTLKDIEQRVKEYQKSPEKVEIPSIIAKETKKIIKSLNLSHQTIKRIYGVKALGEASNIFDESFVFNVSKIDPLLLEIAKRLRLQRSQLIMCRGQEIVDALKHGLPKGFREEIRRRTKNYALILEKGKITLYSGQDYEKYRRQQLKAEAVSQKIKTLKGQAASAGNAKGRVKILLDINEMSKIKKGDILVAPSTYPALVPAMERAAAIVTNEGGLLSHAAIVSRELGIPCVVGTKIATKVLKDGDLVKVDAENGVVKIIKRST